VLALIGEVAGFVVGGGSLPHFPEGERSLHGGGQAGWDAHPDHLNEYS
jgi:hypothetical protein